MSIWHHAAGWKPAAETGYPLKQIEKAYYFLVRLFEFTK